MTDIDPAATRADLERTGNLFTQDENDPGHISNYWRKRIAELCDALEAASPDAAPQPPQEQVDALTRAVRGVFNRSMETELARAVLLVSEALPRMQTLNNATSQRWLPLAEAFLAGRT